MAFKLRGDRPCSSGRRVYDAGHLQRVSQSALVEHRLTAGFPATVSNGISRYPRADGIPRTSTSLDSLLLSLAFRDL